MGLNCSEKVNVFSDEPAFDAFLKPYDNNSLSLLQVGQSSKRVFDDHLNECTMIVIPQGNRLDIKYNEDYSFIYRQNDRDNDNVNQGFKFCWDISGFIPLVEFHTYIIFKEGIEIIEGNLTVLKKANGKKVLTYNLLPV